MKPHPIYLCILCLVLIPAFLRSQDETGIPRPEHPRPQFQRDGWVNLNGSWTYRFDFAGSGREKDFANSTGFTDTITVPFCPESRLSGVAHTDFMPSMWYHRTFSVPATWQGKDILLHFGAVDYACELFINGHSAGRHWGGASSFSFDITNMVRPGITHHLVVQVGDDTRSGQQPGGKQSPNLLSSGCMYTRTTGIWQTVWLEAVHPFGLESCRIIPDPDNGIFILVPVFRREQAGNRFEVTVDSGEGEMRSAGMSAVNGVPMVIALDDPELWTPEKPFLYNITLRVLNPSGEPADHVTAYAGLRRIHIEGNRLYLNNEPVYLRFMLDQGFYPDAIWTAPSDSALKNDILLAQKAGFNGARLHQKAFEERYHYWADYLGFLTFAESPSWGMDANNETGARNFISEWEELVCRDLNHPSIIAWTPFNETWERGGSDGRQHNRLLTDIYELTRNLDPTRPVHDVSGLYHVKTDIWSVHCYEQDPGKFRDILAPDSNGVYRMKPDREAPYSGQPYMVAEYGGIKWIPGKAWAENSWGYGQDPTTMDEFYTRLEDLTRIILDFGHVCGFCYTQLYDIEQEQNGIYNYDRTEKFDMKRIRSIFTHPAGD
ncbi:MAG: beta-glucuronidase [Bacteroidales bacterium]|nr:beta-glucuronidase [Bacteroidales bacterium]